jgi:catechol 2,3-dioxygenase-like lactoylglutathione lyase family enzyme
VTGIHHTAIVTTDVERSMRFWCDGLGFTELFDHTFTGDWPTLFNARTDRLRSIFLGDPNAPDTGLVELVQFGRGREERDVIGVVVWDIKDGDIHCDVSDPESVSAAIEHTVAGHGTPDRLVACAGVGASGLLRDQAPAD